MEDAQLAAAAHARAIDFIEELQAKEGIACDFARIDGFLFAAPERKPDLLEREYDAVQLLGMTDVEWAKCPPLTGMHSACLRFPRQGRFHPLKYLGGLLRCIERDRGAIHCARVVGVEDGPRPAVVTGAGLRVEAESVVVATNSPISSKVTIHAKQAPYRTYVVAGRIPEGAANDALCWDTGDPYHYTRLQPGPAAGSDLVIIGGEDHKTGQAVDMARRLQRLEAWARERYPQLATIEFRWSGQVMETIDYLGLAGRTPGYENVYVATGDSGMGMTHGTIAAMAISDLICKRENVWAKLFDPGRVTTRAAAEFLRENVNVAMELTERITAGEVKGTERIAPGSGAVMRRGLRKLAVFRDEAGALHERSAICTHLGCVVRWNPLEGCWDCPCHGSQFAPDGAPLNAPAIEPLAPVEARRARSAAS